MPCCSYGLSETKLSFLTDPISSKALVPLRTADQGLFERGSQCNAREDYNAMQERLKAAHQITQIKCVILRQALWAARMALAPLGRFLVPLV